MNIKDMSIEDRITNSKFYYFDDGYLGSTNHGAGYYEGYDSLEDMNNIEMTGEDGLRSIDLNQEWYEEYVYGQNEDENGNNIPGMNYNEYWNKWFSDTPEYQIIDDHINGGNGYGKIIVNQNTKTITIMVVPCIYSIEGESERDDIKIFGFDYNTGQLVREINDDDLDEIMSDEDLYIGLAFKIQKHIFTPNKKHMTVEHLIMNEEFMNKFITLANSSFEHYGSYEDVYSMYGDEMNDDDILTLLDYCEDNDLLEW